MIMMIARSSFLLFFLLPFFSNDNNFCCWATPVLDQLHIITRNGIEHGHTKELTLTGEKQMYLLGKWLRNRYGDNFLNDDGGLYHRDLHRFEVAAFKASDAKSNAVLSSSNFLSLGLFPNNRGQRLQNPLIPELDGHHYSNIIPIYIPSEERNDIYINSYDTCPTYNTTKESMYQSDAWLKTQEQNMDFLRNLAQEKEFEKYVKEDGNNGKYIPLQRLRKVYYLVQATQMECIETPDLPICKTFVLEDDVLLQLKQLTLYTELNRMQIAKDLLGGNLLFRIHQRIKIKSSDNDDKDKNNIKLYHYSASYHTIPNILATLGLIKEEEAFVNFGDALILEYYRDASKTNEDKVSLLYYNSRAALEADSNPTNQQPKDDIVSDIRFTMCPTSGLCPFTEFTQYLMNDISYTSPLEWCKACDNQEADICLGGVEEMKDAATTPAPFTISSQQQPSPTPPPTFLSIRESLSSNSNNIGTMSPSSSFILPQTTTKSSSQCMTPHDNLWMVFGTLSVGISIGMIIMITCGNNGFRRLRKGINKTEEGQRIHDPDDMIDLDFSYETDNGGRSNFSDNRVEISIYE